MGGHVLALKHRECRGVNMSIRLKMPRESRIFILVLISIAIMLLLLVLFVPRVN